MDFIRGIKGWIFYIDVPIKKKSLAHLGQAWASSSPARSRLSLNELLSSLPWVLAPAHPSLERTTVDTQVVLPVSSLA